MIFTILVWAELEDNKTIRGTRRAARRGCQMQIHTLYLWWQFM